MFKRIFGVFLCAALLLAVFSGCGLSHWGKSEPPPSSSSTPSAPSESAASEAATVQSENPPPVPAPAEQPVVLYLPNENADGFVTKDAMTDGTAEHIVSLLVEEKALPEGCALLSFTAAEGGGAVADMNAAYGQIIGEGTAAEYLRLGSVVNTLLTFYELTEITITIEGQVPNTGHEIYDYPLRFYIEQ